MSKLDDRAFWFVFLARLSKTPHPAHVGERVQTPPDTAQHNGGRPARCPQHRAFLLCPGSGCVFALRIFPAPAPYISEGAGYGPGKPRPL